MSDTTFLISGGFFDAVDSDRLYSADQMNQPYKKLIHDGINREADGTTPGFAVTAGGGMNVLVATGNAMIGGKWAENKAVQTIAVAGNTSGSARIDSIILQCDKSRAVRAVQIVYRQGTTAAPDLVSDDDITELRLANIRVPSAASAIASENITDTRGGAECPWVRSVFDAPDARYIVEEYTGSELAGAYQTVKSAVDSIRYAAQSGQPTVALQASDMIDSNLVYLYQGSETGYSTGYLYYYSDAAGAWIRGAQYGASVVDTALDEDSENPVQNKAIAVAIKTVRSFVVEVPGSAAAFSGSIATGDFSKALATYTAGSGVYAVKDGEVYQLSAASSSTMTFTQMYHGTMNFIKQIQITSADTFTVTNTALSSSAADTSYNNTTSGLTATDVQAAIDENAAAVTNVNGRLNQQKTALEYAVTANKLQLIKSDAYVGTGTNTMTYDGDGFTSALTENVNCNIGFFFQTEIGKEYTVVVDVTIGTFRNILVTRNRNYSTSVTLARITNVGVGEATLSFTAITTESTLWFEQVNSVSSVTVNEVYINNGYQYSNLDTDLTSETKPAQGKAVGDALQYIPSASWLGYNNLYQMTSADIVTATGDVTKTVASDSITLKVNASANSLTSYAIKGLKSGLTYIFEFESDTDFTLKNQTAQITKNATATLVGDTYARFSKNGTLYTCAFKAIDYPLYFAIPLKYNAGTVVIKNITIRQASVACPKNEYCDYTGKAITSFNKCLCIGDSLTYGGFNADNVDPDVGIDVLAQKYSYPTYLHKITGIDVVKKAIGGVTSVGWWNRYGADNLSGFDVAIIQLGVNDASPSKLNGWTQASIDAFTNIINKLEAENKGIKIFVATTVPAPAFTSNKINEVNEGIRALITSLAHPNVILADINTYGHTADSEGYDAGHLTAYGYNRLAMDYVALISYLMDTNMKDYRFIQFIGTNYTYTD